jgi:hypothetical protein
VLQPSEAQPERAQLAVSPTGRAAHVYLLPGEGQRADPEEVRRALGMIEGVDLVCRMETVGGGWVRREEPGAPQGDAVAAVERSGQKLRFRPELQRAVHPWRGQEVAAVSDLRGRRWEVEGDLSVLEARLDGGGLSSEAYPDPLSRVWSALGSPHAGDFLLSLEPGYEAVDWGGVTHAGGGSHGSLHAGDSLGPLLFVGCGPGSASERRQWALRDVAAVVREHFDL